ncbi:MAG: InlB B-repeat-containing protein [Ruminococcus sp.]|nr:InlB B-repeat-containing protein [Ruminococcus sp.]
MKAISKRPVSILLAVLMVIGIFTALPVTAGAAEATVTDSLTAADFSATGSTYTNFSNVSKSSGAVYAGQTAKNSGNIQLRSTYSSSGIVTTASGGTVSKVSVSWSSSTTNGRKLQVYGKSSAYTSAANLYDTSAQGTLLGEIVYGTSSELVVSGSYEYIGLRSASGAMYLSQIDIIWGTGAEIPKHTVTWLNDDGSEIYHESLDEGDTPLYDLDTYGTPAKDEDESNTYIFAGWTQVGGDGTVYAGELPELGESDVSYKACFTAKSKFSLTDTITAAILSATSTSYKAFSDVKYPAEGINSEAVYAGQSAKTNKGSIQLRYDATSGIAVTTSGGKAKKVAVVWDSSTVNGRKLNIYGKDTPYDSSNWTSAIGTKLGTIEKGSSTVFELTVPYEYIAVRSDSGSLYLEKIDIEWDTTPPAPHTVTWMNGDDEIYSEQVAYDTHPVYNEAAYGIPQKADDSFHYTFSGWTNGVNNYPIGSTLPKVKADATYSATFDSTPVYSIVWNNCDGQPVETDTFYGTDAPVSASFDGTPPSKPEDAYYTYVFLGWKDSSGNRYYDISDIPPVSENETFTAIYESAPKLKAGRIVKTNDASVFNTGGKYCVTSPGSAAVLFGSNCAFTDTVTSDGSGVLSINGEIIPITNPLGEPTAHHPSVSEFAHTVYVTGEGTADDPFVFYPNYIFSADVENIHDSTAIDKSVLHPGDGIKGMQRLRMQDAYIRFLQYEDMPDLECAHGTNGFMGVSHTKYGNRYSNAVALPYSFVSGDTLYYLGELTNAYNFSEKIEYDTQLGNVTPAYTVTWANWNGETIRTNSVFRGVSPFYGNIAGSVPVREDDENYRYTFAGWKSGSTTYSADDVLPPVTGNITYTAVYTSRELDSFTITWLSDNGTQLAQNSCKEGKTPVYPHNTPTKASDGQYMYTFAGWTDNGGTTVYTSDSLPAATSDKTYTAVFNASEITPEPGTFTVTWVDWDGRVLETDYHVAAGSAPHYDGETPAREADDTYSYTFIGWYPHLQEVSFNVTYRAQYAETPLVPVPPVEDIENIFRTNDNRGYDLEGMFYSYNGSEPLRLEWDGLSVFSRIGDHLILGGKTVADIGVTLYESSYHAEFIDSVFVSGTGTYSDPFVFHPNYLYYGTKSTITNGCPVALKEEYIQNSQKIKSVSYPGDQYKGNTIVKVGNTSVTQEVQFADYSNEYLSVENNYVGIGASTYGTHYDGTTAYIESGTDTPHNFKPGNSVLYYHGEDENNAFVFAEEPPVYQQSFGDPETFTVTWKNSDGTTLDTESYYYGETPVFKGEIPTGESLVFNGWTPEITEVTADAVYTATFRGEKFFAGHSLTLRGDIGIYFYIDVTAAGITPQDIQNGSSAIDFSFSWSTDPAPYSDLSAYNIQLNKDNFNSLYDGSRYFKILCDTAVAEMSCVVHADAEVKNASGSTTYTDSDEYCVRDYAMTIINDPENYSESLVTLAKEMLNYGAKAQVVFGINTGDPADKYVEGYTMQDVSIAMIEEAIAAANEGNTASDMNSVASQLGAKYYTTSLIYLTKCTLRHYFTKDTDAFDPSDYQGNKSNYYYYVQISDIPAAQLDTLQTFTAGNVTFTYSALDFAIAMLKSNTAQPSKDLAKALYWYNHAANDFFI